MTKREGQRTVTRVGSKDKMAYFGKKVTTQDCSQFPLSVGNCGLAAAVSKVAGVGKKVADIRGSEGGNDRMEQGQDLTGYL